MKEETKEKISDWCYKHLPRFFYRIKNKLDTLGMYIKHYLQKIFRKNHISNYDCWGMTSQLSKVIVRYLKAFRKYPRHGYPIEFSDYGECNPFSSGMTEEEYYAKNPGGGMEGWESTLDKMIFAFEYAAIDLLVWDEDFMDFYHKYNITQEEYCEESTMMFNGAEEKYWSFTTEGVEKLQKRYEEGMQLFAKYFLGFWD